MAIEAGRLRHRVTIERPPTLPNDVGELEVGDDSKWEEVSTRWAEVRPASAVEITISQQQKHTISHVVSMRYGTDVVLPNWRLRFNGRILKIQGIINVDERKEELRITCSEA